MCGRSLDNVTARLPQVDFCCCGCTVSTGAKIIGWLNMISAVFLQIALIAVIVGNIVRVVSDPALAEEKKDEVIGVCLVVGAIVTLFWIALAITPAVILLQGVYKNDLKKLRCWLHLNLVLFIIGLVFGCLGVLLQLLINPILAIEHLIQYSISIGITFYFITVVKSYYAKQTAAFQPMSEGHP